MTHTVQAPPTHGPATLAPIDLARLLAPQDEAAAKASKVNAEEYQVILDRLGRAPNLVELGIFSVMWSEHCSYKSTRRHLRKFPTSGPRVIQGPGENAGVIDIGDGDACIFKMESHNHPSFIEPYQGAATGVGGILRDVFTMGARPVALINALRFGSPEHPRTRSLVAGVVAGIGGYGNCVGVPTVAGETQFDAGYNGNILVNAMAVGLAKVDRIFYSRGAQPGQTVFYVGSKTGRDGIHGATMASAEFDDASAEQRPTVQVGDPFVEKLLIEACLELMATDAIEAIQDMGAAGLTSSSAEIAGKGGVGIDIDLDRVPQREPGMTAYEIMLSESQERMLMILKPGQEATAKAIFDKWELDAEAIGVTTATGRMVLRQRGTIVCDIPVEPLSEDAPNYDRPWVMPKPFPALDLAAFEEPADLVGVILSLMSSPDMASKRWIWEQYDRHVMGDTLDSSQSGGDAALVRVHGTNKALALTSDCNPHYVAADPYEGGKQAVAEAYRNLSAVGATPIAITDNLNFGNPERPEIMGQIVRAIEGMAEACRVLDFPVVSGNVSMYNETNGVAIPPTPVVGGVGLIADISRLSLPMQPQVDDVLCVIGATKGHLGASLYARQVLGLKTDEAGPPPPVDLDAERKHADFVRSLIADGLVHTVHDCSEGGLGCAVAELALAHNVALSVHAGATRAVELLFGEDQARFVLVLSHDQMGEVWERMQAQGIPGGYCGEVLSPKRWVSGADGPGLFITQDKMERGQWLALSELRGAHESWLPGFMAG
jgi:phosphoribosylformylglycinamidine synthase